MTLLGEESVEGCSIKLHERQLLALLERTSGCDLRPKLEMERADEAQE